MLSSLVSVAGWPFIPMPSEDLDNQLAGLGEFGNRSPHGKDPADQDMDHGVKVVSVGGGGER